MKTLIRLCALLVLGIVLLSIGTTARVLLEDEEQPRYAEPGPCAVMGPDHPDCTREQWLKEALERQEAREATE